MEKSKPIMEKMEHKPVKANDVSHQVKDVKTLMEKSKPIKEKMSFVNPSRRMTLKAIKIPLNVGRCKKSIYGKDVKKIPVKE